MAERTCGRCGQPFWTQRSVESKHGRKYCSPACRSEAMADHGRRIDTVGIMIEAVKQRSRDYWKARFEQYAPFSERDMALMRDVTKWAYNKGRTAQRGRTA